ncbi:MAG TPA: ABC transporter permease [Thermoanaerobaculia bacterium]|nr:ABC transporter permease [Thermoanaerobaculia bacterium]
MNAPSDGTDAWSSAPAAPGSTLERLVRHRGLLATLVAREVKARYRGSALGFLWSLANPLLLLGVFSLVFGLFFAPRSGDASTSPYPLYLITGLFPWIWASSSLLDGTVALTVNSGLIRKAVFPVDVLPIVTVCAHLVHFLLALPILVGALAIGRLLGHPVLSPLSPLMIVVVALELVMLGGMALGLAVLHVHFKDVRDLLGNVLQLLFFMAPILYSLGDVPWRTLRAAIVLNPFTPFTVAYQRLLFYGDLPAAATWAHMAALALLAAAAGAWLYRRLADTIVEAV